MKPKPFEHWKIDRHHATSPDGKYRFWIASGFLFFRDEGNEQLISIVSMYQKYKIWRELKKEIISRIDDVLMI